MSLETKNIDAWVTYMQRLPMEIQALFGINIMASSKRDKISKNKTFVDWAIKNEQFF